MTGIERKIIKLGDLAVELGLVSHRDLNEALQIGKDMGLPIGRVLTMSAFLSEAQLQAALRAQELLKQGLCDFASVKDAVRLVTEGKSVDEAFASIGIGDVAAETVVKLSELLEKSALVPESEVQAAIEQSKTTGLPVGRLLLLSGSLSEVALSAALDAQVLVRDGRITKQQAIDSLKNSRRRHVSIEISLAEQGLEAKTGVAEIKLGELLVQASIISFADVVNAIEIGLIKDKPVGQVLLELDRLDGALLQYALRLQKQIKIGELTKTAALEALKNAKHNGVPDNALVANQHVETTAQPLKLVKFLRQVGQISDENITTMLQSVINDDNLTSELLLRANIVEPRMVDVANQLREMLEVRKITPAWATVLYKHCMAEHIDVDEAAQIISAPHVQVRVPETKVESEAHLPEPEPKPEPKPAAPTQVSSISSTPTVEHKFATKVVPEPEIVPERQTAAKVSQTQEAASVWDGIRKLGEERLASGSWPEAEQYWVQAVKVAERLGENDPRFAYSLEKLSESILNQNRFEEAEPILLRAHTLKLRILGEEHLSLATSLHNLSKLYYFLKRYEQAESLAKQFVNICEKNLGTEHPDVACGMHNLATLYHMSGRLEDAEAQYVRALEINRKSLGGEHPNTIKLMKSYAALLKALERNSEAELLDGYTRGTISGTWKDYRNKPESLQNPTGQTHI